MLNSFMAEKEDEEHVIYLVASTCATNMETLGPCFYLILQLLYSDEIIHEEAILEWLASARSKIEESEKNPSDAAAAEENKAEAAEGDNAEDDFYGSEDHSQDPDAEKPIEIDTMKQFVAGMKQFEEHLKSQLEAGGDEDAEYYDEEEGGEDGY